MVSGGRDGPKRVKLYAPCGVYFGAAINGRWYESPPCKNTRCAEEGPHVHTFDIETGRMVTNPVVTEDVHEMRSLARDVPARKAG